MSDDRIIFLDFDGVLNHQIFFQRTRQETKGQIVLARSVDIDPFSVGQLNNLIERTGAKVVVSSTWRLGRTVEELQEMLSLKNFQGTIIGITPDFRGEKTVRGNEIEAWRKVNRHSNYVILDDDSDMLLWHRHNFIKVDSYCGLTPNNVYLAEKILKNGCATGINCEL